MSMKNFLKLTVAYDSSGIGLYYLISNKFYEFNLDMSKIIGWSFDGTNNMNDVYNSNIIWQKKKW